MFSWVTAPPLLCRTCECNKKISTKHKQIFMHTPCLELHNTELTMNKVIHSAVECRRMWGPLSQPGVVLNFLNSSQFTFLYVIKPVCILNFLNSSQFTFLSVTKPVCILNFLNSSQFTFLSVIKPVCMKVVQRVTSVHVEGGAPTRDTSSSRIT